MIKERVILDNEMDKCKELYNGLCDIMKAYESLPIFEEIHSNSGNKLLSTNNGHGFREALFAEAFNKLIIKYVSNPSNQLEDDDEW